jgi:hypothetical protein
VKMRVMPTLRPTNPKVMFLPFLTYTDPGRVRGKGPASIGRLRFLLSLTA